MINSTKDIIAASFEKLLETKEFEKITVNDIVEDCGASRPTFYYHFKDKYEIMGYIYNREIEKLRDFAFEEESMYKFSLSFTTFLKSKKTYFSKIFKIEGQNSFTESVINFTFEFSKKEYNKYLGDNISEELLSCTKVFNAGMVYYIKQWVLGGCAETPEYVAKILCKSIPENIQKYCE